MRRYGEVMKGPPFLARINQKCQRCFRRRAAAHGWLQTSVRTPARSDADCNSTSSRAKVARIAVRRGSALLWEASSQVCQVETAAVRLPCPLVNGAAMVASPAQVLRRL